MDISPAGPWGEPGRIAELAAFAERCGWDGVFCEDYFAYPGGLPTYDPWITLGLIAQATERIEPVTHHGRYFTLDGAASRPLGV